jgi:hypothetical protein
VALTYMVSTKMVAFRLSPEWTQADGRTLCMNGTALKFDSAESGS